MENFPICQLKNLSALTTQRLAKLGILSIQDLLFHLPIRYQDKTRCYPLGELQIGQQVLIEGRVENFKIKKDQPHLLIVTLRDSTGFITLKWFHFYPNQKYEIGEKLRCFGEVRNGLNGLEIYHPKVQRLNSDVPLENTLTPIYRTTEGLSQRQLRKLISQALQFKIPELLPTAISNGLPTLEQSLHAVHFPSPQENIEQLLNGQHPARQRLALEELLAHHLSLRLFRQQIQAYQAPLLTKDSYNIQQFIKTIPFQLTKAQQKVYQEILDDVTKPSPMQRLIQGDVGSGKTIVAALAALHAVESGLQVVIMSPLELLAEQHFQNFNLWFKQFNIKIFKLTSSLTQKQKQQAKTVIFTGEAQIIIGTHALFQKDVQFKKLGLIIIDEQHRFGVQQRLSLQEKGIFNNYRPHLLMMTATPIPRTLALTLYADFDISIIDELPPGRIPIQTVVIPISRRGEIIEKLAHLCSTKQQVYWVCPLIDESKLLEIQTAQATFHQLRRELPALKIGLVHGKLESKEKEQILKSFQKGNLDILVTTTVIEVGVDVPNASIMIIDHAERMGLSQLHQLRGRVGRGSLKSTCVLLYQPPLSAPATARLALLRESQDGFLIAQRDLELRGPGDLLGLHQTGSLKLRVVDWQQHHDLLQTVSLRAEQLLKVYPKLVLPLIRRWVPDFGLQSY